MNLSLGQKRVGAAILLLMVFMCAADYYAGWEILGRHGPAVTAGVFVAMYIFLIRVGSTTREPHHHQDGDSPGPAISARRRPWVFLLTIAIVLSALLLLGPLSQLAKKGTIQKDDWIELVIMVTLAIIAGIVGWPHRKSPRNGESGRR